MHQKRASSLFWLYSFLNQYYDSDVSEKHMFWFTNEIAFSTLTTMFPWKMEGNWKSHVSRPFFIGEKWIGGSSSIRDETNTVNYLQII